MNNPNRNKLFPREADGSRYPWWCYVLLYGSLFIIWSWLWSVVSMAF